MEKKNIKAIEIYQRFISKILVDENIKKEINEIVNIFKEDGKLVIDGYDLYGKVLNKEFNDYLEIKYQNGDLNCNYTKWEGISKIAITQTDLKNGNKMIVRRESEKIKHLNNNNINSFNIKEIKKIYNKNLILLYKSKFKSNTEFDSLNDKLIYMEREPFANSFDLTKTWYIENGSIIKYSLKKSFLEEKNYSQIKEKYFICEDKESIEGCYHFIPLKEELFKQFMSGEININDLINKIYELNILEEKEHTYLYSSSRNDKITT